MADPSVGNNGGYLDGWYQVLDTPIISLPSTGNIQLRFQQYRSIEEPSSYQNFDGWDGFNVRIRLAGQEYSQAEILTNCNPSYNCTSLYSFGFVHDESAGGSPGIPGWGGFSDWHLTQIEIPSAFLGQDIIISFAFAADEYTSTATNPEFTGIFIDEIEISGVFYNDGEDATGFNGFTNTPIGGDLWHVDYDISTDSHILGCFNAETGFYNPNMKNYLTTSNIFLPNYPEIYFDMSVQTAFDDSLFPECDFFSVEVSYLTGGVWSNWNSVSNPTGNPALPNLVFTGSSVDWILFSEGWNGFNDLSALASHSVRFRFGLHSNSNIPDDFGILIDDFHLYSNDGSSLDNSLASQDFALKNFPNPFSLSGTGHSAFTTISFSLNAESIKNTELAIYNIKGQKVNTLSVTSSQNSKVSAVWNGRDKNNQPLSSGVYFYRLYLNGKLKAVSKCLLLK